MCVHAHERPAGEKKMQPSAEFRQQASEKPVSADADMVVGKREKDGEKEIEG